MIGLGRSFSSILLEVSHVNPSRHMLKFSESISIQTLRNVFNHSSYNSVDFQKHASFSLGLTDYNVITQYTLVLHMNNGSNNDIRE
jgi:hypothetical protein